MRLATIRAATPHSTIEARDGRLVVISKDGTRIAVVPRQKVPSLLSAFDAWDSIVPYLREIERQLESDTWIDSRPITSCHFMAPLPRTWAFLDGSAFLSHVVLVRKARGAEPPPNMRTVPLMYQGVSDTFIGPTDPVPLIDGSFGLDFEGEVAVVLDDVPMGVSVEEAPRHIQLIVLCNDWTLRNLVHDELQAGFGFLQSKPASSFAPFALTPDELGVAWQKARVHLPLTCTLNGARVGNPDSGEMHFSFGELIAHAARTRHLRAGTIIGSGTVSNEDEGAGISCLAELRMREKIATGSAITPFLKSGDTVEIAMSQDGKDLFGEFKQTVRAVRPKVA